MSKKQEPTLSTKKVSFRYLLDQKPEVEEFYKKYSEISNITKKINIAMGRKKTYKYSFGSTETFEMDSHALPPTIQSYKI